MTTTIQALCEHGNEVDGRGWCDECESFCEVARFKVFGDHHEIRQLTLAMHAAGASWDEINEVNGGGGRSRVTGPWSLRRLAR